MTLEQMWDALEEMGVSEQTLQIITDINGYNEQAMLDILYAYSGERDFDFLDEEIEHKPTTEKLTIKESDSDPVPVYNTGSIYNNTVYVDTTRLSWVAGQIVLQNIYRGQPAVLIDTSYNRHANNYDVCSATPFVRGENKYLGVFI